MFVSPDRPTKIPPSRKFLFIFRFEIIFFLRLFRPKIIVFDVLLHSTESDAASLDSDSSQPIICLVLQEPPETTILLADIFSSAPVTWNPFLTFVFDQMIDFSAAKALNWQMHLSPFELFTICRILGSHTPRRPQSYIKILFCHLRCPLGLESESELNRPN